MKRLSLIAALLFDPRLALNVQKGCAPSMMLFDHPNEG